jgi:hypothetical protein
LPRTLQKLRLFGDLAEVALQPRAAHTAPVRPYVDVEVIFPDGDLQDRVRSLLKHYRPYGAVDLFVVPLHDIAAMRAARELELLRLIVRKASAPPHSEVVVNDPRFDGCD